MNTTTAYALYIANLNAQHATHPTRSPGVAEFASAKDAQATLDAALDAARANMGALKSSPRSAANHAAQIAQAGVIAALKGQRPASAADVAWAAQKASIDA